MAQARRDIWLLSYNICRRPRTARPMSFYTRIHPAVGPPPGCAAWTSRIHDAFISDDPHPADHAWTSRHTMPARGVIHRRDVRPPPVPALPQRGVPAEGMVALPEAERWIGGPAEAAQNGS
jgi:hypothetical protein